VKQSSFELCRQRSGVAREWGKLPRVNMPAHTLLFANGSPLSLPPSSFSFTYSSTWSSPAVVNNSVKWGSMHRMNGVRWANRRIVILDGKMKKQQQIKASVQAPNATDTCPDYIPKANFYKVEAILRPWRMSHVTSGLLKLGIRGVTVSDVKGFGAQGGSAERQAGSEFFKDNFVSKVKMEIVVSKDQVEAVIDTIIDEARTGEIGDGKIFVVPVADVIRVRTGERGLEAERMAGGRSEILTGSREEVTDSN